MSTYPPRKERAVLQGVPRVHFYEGDQRCPEEIILPAVGRALLAFLGEKDFGCKHDLDNHPDCRILCTYAFLVGVTGAASFLSWKEGWHGDNIALAYMSADPREPERRLFDAVGYEIDWVDKEAGRDNEMIFRQRIIESIERGMPVLAYGVIGPPEPSIIAGYDQGGDVLVGWSFFQDANTECEPSGYFRKGDWFPATERLLIIGDKKEKPTLKEASREAMRWMRQVARTPVVRPEPDAPEPYQNRHNGLAAYEAWARHLLDDAAWPVDDVDRLCAHHRIHRDATFIVASARWYGSVFMAERVEDFVAGPKKRGAGAEILHAAACYAAEHDLIWEIWELAGGIGNRDAYRAMADPDTRRAMADLVLQAREQEVQALAHLEHALA